MCNHVQPCGTIDTLAHVHLVRTARLPAESVAEPQPAAPAADFCSLNGGTFEPTTVGDLFKCMKVALTENNTGGNTLFATKADPDFVPVCMKVGEGAAALLMCLRARSRRSQAVKML